MKDVEDSDESLLNKMKLENRCRLSLMIMYRLNKWIILEWKMAFKYFIRTFLVFLHLGVNNFIEFCRDQLFSEKLIFSSEKLWLTNIDYFVRILNFDDIYVDGEISKWFYLGFQSIWIWFIEEANFGWKKLEYRSSIRWYNK
jgi:hypothetical protein